MEIKNCKILFIVNTPSPYRVDFFNELGKKTNLTVVFETSFSSERDNSWKSYNITNFKAIFFNSKRIGVASAMPFGFKKIIKQLYPMSQFTEIFICNYSSIIGCLFVRYCIKHHLPYIIEGDGAFAKTKKDLKEFVKRHIISNAKMCLATSDVHVDYYLRYGCQAEDIIKYPFSSVTDKDIQTIKDDPHDITVLSNKFGVDLSKKTIISVGQFIDRKNFDITIQVAKMMSHYNFLLVGSGPFKKHYQDYISKNDLCNVTIIDFLKKKDLFSLMSCCSVFLLPTKEDIWGLVVNEALSCGIPVITTSNCLAGLELIKNGENGFVIPSNETNNIYTYINAINALLEIDQKTLKQNCYSVASKYTIEQMSNKHCEIIKNEQDIKKVLFLGYLESQDKVLSGMSVAGNKMQYGLINGIIDNKKIRIKCISIKPIAPFPKDVFYSKKEISNVDQRINVFNVPFINVSGLKQFFQSKAIRKYASKTIYKYGVDCVLTFNCFPQIGRSFNYIKRKHSIPIIVYLADCPIPQIKMRGIRKAYRNSFDKKTLSSMKYADAFVLINKYISQKYNILQNYIIIEGGIEEHLLQKEPSKDKKEDIVFSGALSNYNGLIELIKCFETNNLHGQKLFIYGRGELENECLKHQTESIVFKGFVSNSEMLNIERNSRFLILLRDPTDEISKVTFPSKIFEYMSTGTPIICSNLDTLSDEYNQYLNIIKWGDIQYMSIQIKECLSKDYNVLVDKAKSGRLFLAKNKTWLNQANKITSFIIKVIDEYGEK